MFLFDFLCGTAEYQVKCSETESFINSVKKHISLKKLRLKESSEIRFSCFYRERHVAEEKIRQSGASLIFKKYKGLPVIAAKMKKRAGLAAGVVLSLVAVFLSSMFVWEIRVEGNEKISDERVIMMLEKAGFREGMIKKRVDVKKVSDRLLVNEDDVSWIAINFDGNVAHVEMKEAMKAMPYEKKENVNLVAKTNGIILRVDALEGGTKVKKGDAVTKGQLLVSAFVDKRTGGSLLRGARGYVWANTERCFCVEVPLEYYVKNYTGKLRDKYVFSFLGVKMKLFNPRGNPNERYEYEKSIDKVKLFGNTVLPVTVEKTKCSEYAPYCVRRTEKAAIECARKTAKERLFEASSDFVLLDLKESHRIENNKLVYECTFYGIENIAGELEFELS